MGALPTLRAATVSGGSRGQCRAPAVPDSCAAIPRRVDGALLPTTRTSRAVCGLSPRPHRCRCISHLFLTEASANDRSEIGDAEMCRTHRNHVARDDFCTLGFSRQPTASGRFQVILAE